ncbi:unnamed protein product, partial [Prorocentrum cordatum]
ERSMYRTVEKRHKDRLSAFRADFLDPRWSPRAAPVAPPLARSARQGGGSSADLRNPRGAPKFLCMPFFLFLRAAKEMRHLVFAHSFLLELVAAIQSSQVSFNEGPTFPDDHPGILAAQSKRTQLKIPLQLVMTAKAGGVDDLPPKQRDNVRETLALNPELTLRFLTDEDCRGFISKNYEPDLLSAFDNEKHGSYRGDICRAAVIAIEGGFYADLDVQFRVPFVKMVDEGTTFMSALRA